MKRVLVFGAVLGLAASAMAEITPVMPATQLDASQLTAVRLDDTGRSFPYLNPHALYDNYISLAGGPSSWPSGATLAISSGGAIDDVHGIAGTATDAHWVGYLAPGLNPVTLAFFSNPAGADSGPFSGSTFAAFSGAFSNPGSGGLFFLSFGGLATAIPADLWMGTFGGASGLTWGGPGGGTGVAVGSSHTGVGLLASGNMHYAIGGIAVPEPATIALLGLGGLLVLRRRR